jgi:hypothetical protein
MFPIRSKYLEEVYAVGEVGSIQLNNITRKDILLDVVG